MYKRYIDSAIANKVDFVFRSHDISIFKILAILTIIPLSMLMLIVFNIENGYITTIVTSLLTLCVGIFVAIKLKHYLKIIGRIEYQNMIFANALNHNTEFCLIIDQRGQILYSDTRFRQRFKTNIQETDVFNILDNEYISENDIHKLKNALKNRNNIQIEFSIHYQQENKSSNFSLLLDPVPDNPETAVFEEINLNLFLFPLARTNDYFVLKAIKVTKEQIYKDLIENHCTPSYLLNNKNIIISANKSFLKLFEIKELEKDRLFSSLVAQPHKEAVVNNEIMLSTITGTNFLAYVTKINFHDKYNNCYTYGLLTPLSSTIDYQYHPCFKEASIAIAHCSSDGTILKKNKSLIQMVGNNIETIFDAVSSYDDKKIKKYFDNETINNMSIEVQLYNNHYVKLHFNKFMHDDDIFVICYFIDSADRKKLEFQLERSQKIQSIGQLAGGIAHDFNNILTAIMGFCDLLLNEHSPTHPSFPNIIQIKQLSNRAADLIKQLLAFSRKQTLQPKILNSNNVIADLIPMIKRLINESIELEVHYERNIGLIKVDICQLEQVIVNLVVNSRSAMEMGGKLTIKTYNMTVDSLDKKISQMFSPDEEKIECGEYVVMEVKDTGYGIAQNNIIKIFEPFFSTKEASSGGGLGLSTVYGIIKQTGGYIYVESKINFGTTFVILFPRVYILEKKSQVTPKKQQEEIPAPESEKSKKSITILLIEDEDPVRMLTSKALVDKGYKLIDTNCAKKALKIIEHASVDLIISDVVMPGISGPEAVEQIIKVHPHIKVIFISGYAEEVFKKYNNIISIGNIKFLPKPFTLKQVSKTVEDLLNTEPIITSQLKETS